MVADLWWKRLQKEHIKCSTAISKSTKSPKKWFWHRIKGKESRNINKLLSKRRFCSILIGHITVIFHYFSQYESVILKMDSCTSKRYKRNTHMFYDSRDIDGCLEATLVWIHPIHHNLCRTPWPRVGNI